MSGGNMALTIVHNERTKQESPNKRGYTGFVPAPYDYSKLAANLASAAKESAERIRRSQRDHIIEVGLELLKVKELLAHGHFTDWVDRALNFSPTTARNYMRAAEAFATKPATVAVLPPATLYRLAGAPLEVRNEINARVEAGEYVDREEVDEAIRRPKQEAAEAKRIASGQAKKEADARRRRDRRERKWQKSWEAEQEQERQRRQGAAEELIQMLAERFDQNAILRLIKLWNATRHDDVLRIASRSAESCEASR